MTTVFASPDELPDAVGTHLGYGDWITVDQDRIDLFAEATGDHQWIHVDPERAAAGPFGATIAHGYLTLALANQMLPGLVRVDGSSMGCSLTKASNCAGSSAPRCLWLFLSSRLLMANTISAFATIRCGHVD